MTIYGKKPRKIRCLIALTIFILLISFLVGGLAAQANDDGNNDDSQEQLIIVYVTHGDTLWSLVNKYCDPQKDIRKTIYEVEKLNNIINANIYEGQIIYLPSNNQ